MQLFIGLMSGTSVDAIDAALVSFDENQTIKLEHFTTQPYPLELKDKIAEMRSATARFSFKEVAELDIKLGHLFAKTVGQLLSSAKMSHENIMAIGSHGQTIFHSPDSVEAFTLQIGDPSTIAATTSITTVADFRSMDIAVGGQGAPLAPGFHAELFRHPKENRVVLNLGGIANITFIPSSATQPIRGFDTGPANCLMDDWVLKILNKPYDDNGSWGQQGTVSSELLAKMLADDYFKKSHPKSTGREYFNLQWLNQKLGTSEHIPKDIQATLQQLTVSSIANSIITLKENVAELIICGGGAHNQQIIRLLSETLTEIDVKTTDAYGVDPDSIEAMAFAWLAKRRLDGLPGNLPSVTGASKEVLLGGIYG